MSGTVHFGGPDRKPGALRDLLEQRVNAVPSGGTIDWMTYYFRDRRLAQALVHAHQRGVGVRVCVEGSPRHRGANDVVIAILKRGIAGGLRVDRRMFGASHLHTKLYCFSGPDPHALVGSFNPSGNNPEDVAVVADIGDQDRGHNLLVELTEGPMVAALAGHVASVHAGQDGMKRFARGDDEAWVFPRLGANPLVRRLRQLGSGSRLRIAASHVRDPSIVRELGAAAQRGVSIAMILHHTLRRSPESLARRLRDAGVDVARYDHPDALPMHAKFILAENASARWSAFGSYNLTRTSRWLNQELLMVSANPSTWRALDERWSAISQEPWCKR